MTGKILLLLLLLLLLLFYLRGRETTEENCHLWVTQILVTVVRQWELEPGVGNQKHKLNSGFPHIWRQELNHFSYHLLPPRLCSGRQLEKEVEARNPTRHIMWCEILAFSTTKSNACLSKFLMLKFKYQPSLHSSCFLHLFKKNLSPPQ